MSGLLLLSKANSLDIDWSNHLNDGLIAWWPFVQKGGTVVRDVVGGNNPAFSASLSQSNWGGGFNAQGLWFPNDTDYRCESSTVATVGTKFTVSAWVWSDTTSGTSTVVSQTGSAGVHDFRLTRQSSVYNFHVDDGTNEAYGQTASSTVAVNKWQHLVGTRDGDTVKLYLDGVPAASEVGASPGSIGAITATSLDIGAHDVSVWTWPWSGGIGDIRIYDRTLTDGEAKALYREGVEGDRNVWHRKSFPVTTPDASTDVTSVANIIKVRSPQQTQPSIKSGYARSASESAFPALWDGMINAWLPMLGPADINLRDYVGNVHMTETGTPYWQTTERGWARYQGANADTINSTTYQDIGTEDRSWTILCNWDIEGGPDLLADRELGAGGTKAGFFIGRGGNAPTTGVPADGMRFTIDDGNTNSKTEWFKVGTGFLNVTFTWHNATGTIRCFVDGVEKASNYDSADKSSGTIAGQSIGSYGTLEIGGRPNTGDRDYIGNLHTVIVHDRVLPQNEIKLLHADPLAPFRKRRQIMFATPEEAAAYHIYLSMAETGRFGINNGQLGVRES